MSDKTNEAFTLMSSELQRARRDHIEWVCELDRFTTANRDAAERLIATAPSPFLAGLVVGQLIRNIEAKWQ